MTYAGRPKGLPHPGQRVGFDPLRIGIHYHESGRTRVMAKAGKRVEVSVRTPPKQVQVA